MIDEATYFEDVWSVESAKVVHPNLLHVVHDTFIPHLAPGGITADLVFLVVGIVGTTIAPWWLFFQQSCVADKRLHFKDLKWARLDTFLGAVFTVVVGGCMMLAGNVAKIHGLEFVDSSELATDIGGFCGPFVKYAILLLMINAAVLGTTAGSLASSWAYGEVRGWPHSLQLPFNAKHIHHALIAEGYAVDYAQDGDEALWLAENNTYNASVGFALRKAYP